MSSSNPPTPGTILSPPLPPSTPLSSSIRPSPTMWFTSEIQQMMHGFGDCRKPLNESAAMIEEIVRTQMATALYQSEDIARQRNARSIGIEDFIFLLRKDKKKLRRLLRYLDLRDNKMALKMPDEEETESVDTMKHARKRRKICVDFLSIIDQTGELMALLDDSEIDEVKHERALRAEAQTQYMDVQQYLEYTEARQASFTPRFKSQRFRDWVMAGLSLDIKPNPLALEVLGYLAYETVAQVVDLALLVKQDRDVSDPMGRAAPPLSISHSMLSTFNSSMNPTATSTTTPSQPPSPLNSPPSTPTAASPASASAATSATKKQKKKKKSGGIESKQVSLQQAITPAEICEAMRRFQAPTGPFHAFSKSAVISKTALLAM